MSFINFYLEKKLVISDYKKEKQVSLKIKDTPVYDRPYEKLEKYGERYLTDTELLSIIIKSGSTGISATTIAQKLMTLNKNNLGLSYLIKSPIEDLMQLQGIGKVKAITIKAAIELGIRAGRQSLELENTIIKSPDDVFLYFKEEMEHLTHEELKIVLLDSKNSVMKISQGAIGSVSEAIFTPRIIFKDALKYDAASIILVHNHPSGNSKPSSNDINTTKSLMSLGESLGVNVLDHLVIGKHNFTSIQSLIM